MNMKVYFVYFAIFFLLLSGCTKPTIFPSGNWIDLTHVFSSETIYCPTSETFELE